MLIMDNDRMALMALQLILSKALPDFELLPPVSEGSKAIQLCTATKHPPAVLLADIAMNDINGPECGACNPQGKRDHGDTGHYRLDCGPTCPGDGPGRRTGHHEQER
ncbi:hypothetical protein [Bifidobacterium longum]|uniref:hypothetical protein n=1 Tax=Bifidobacterium longum TaxID=216816 RepID=UPI00215B558D|nr:hypothetical protein [Bifidobacterium longum]